MLASFHFVFQSGSLSITQRRRVISLIPKKNKDKSILENLRPITLLNVDYKILTKVIAKRIEKTLPKIINPDQTGYVQYCAKVTQANFDEFLGFSWLFEEIILQRKFPRLFRKLSRHLLFYSFRTIIHGGR